mmetsp:Transcript_114630/g.220881  ORF Transcript_114630/g.220881 Transcript_114630/m.220881 type:complete len:984 (-) Transcript_114630:115-3066(-)
MPGIEDGRNPAPMSINLNTVEDLESKGVDSGISDEGASGGRKPSDSSGNLVHTQTLQVRPASTDGGSGAADDQSQQSARPSGTSNSPEGRGSRSPAVRFEVEPSSEKRVSFRSQDGVPSSGGSSGRPSIRATTGRKSVKDSQMQRKTLLRQRIQASEWYHGKFASNLRQVLHGKRFAIIMAFALFIALLLPELWVLCGVNSNIEIDVILLLVMIVFTFELCALSAVDATYFLSFFFLMDIIGTFSMIFDISWMLGIDNTEEPIYTSTDTNTKDNLIFLRAARAARVGARAGRLSRVLRILRFLPFLAGGPQEDEKEKAGGGLAMSISRQLANLLATRVACLTIILVILIPIFDILSFPQNDYALQTWVERLSEELEEGFDLGFYRDLNAMVIFFERRSYGPYRACRGTAANGGFTCTKEFINGWKPIEEAPPRGASALLVHTGTFMVGFNMHKPVQLDHGLAILNIAFIIFIMIFSGLALSSVVTQLAVRPLERMLETVRKIASTVFKFSAEIIEEDENDGEEYDIDSSSEMKLLEKVVHRLAIVADLQSSHSGPQVEEDMGDEDIGILNMMQGKDMVQEGKRQANRRVSVCVHGGKMMSPKAALGTPVFSMSEFGCSQDTYYSYRFNSLTLSKQQMTNIGFYAISTFHDDGDGFFNTESDRAVLSRFVQKVESEYLPNPFHNFSHGIDVLHGVCRMMRMMQSETFLTELEQFSLLIAALGHDLGHPGVNNGFLSEVGHELALQYNDLSPLENMHVSKLYNIVVVQDLNVFQMLPKEQYKEVRRYCIETILHTDMMGHQAMVKDLQMVFQMNVEIFTKGDTPSSQVFNQPASKTLVMNNILHSADVSNPCRTWEVSHAWANCVLEEFFSQGDQEKMLGVPVQFLNDRDKLNRPNSQIGFLEFMIAPFFIAQIKLFPKMHEYGDHLAHNLKQWEDMWVKEVNPEEEAKTKVRARVEGVKNNLEEAKKSGALLLELQGGGLPAVP